MHQYLLVSSLLEAIPDAAILEDARLTLVLITLKWLWFW